MNKGKSKAPRLQLVLTADDEATMNKLLGKLSRSQGITTKAQVFRLALYRLAAEVLID